MEFRSFNVTPDALHALLAQAEGVGFTCRGWAPYITGADGVVVQYRIMFARPLAADGRRLDEQIVDVPGAGWCMQCAATVPMTELFGACPQCGSHQVQATGGTEMRVREIEIE